MQQILIIGLGSMGWNHLLSVSHIPDINVNILSHTLKENINISDLNKIATRVENIDEITDGIDLAIVCVGASEQGKIYKSLLKKNNIKIIILEKNISNSIDTLDEIKRLSEHWAGKTYINLPMMNWPIFKDIEFILREVTIKKVNVSIYPFSLITNAIHYVHLINHLTNNLNFKRINLTNYGNWRETKRKNVYDINGKIETSILDDIHFTVETKEANILYDEISIHADKFTLRAKLFADKSILETDDNKNKLILQNYPVWYQSVHGTAIIRSLIYDDLQLLPEFSAIYPLQREILVSIKNNKEISTEGSGIAIA